MANGEQGTNARLVRGAVAGVIAGLVASFAMDRFQAIAAKATGSESDGEPTTAKAADGVSRAVTGKAVAEPDQPLAGQMVHYALGTALGLAYGIAAEFRPATTAGYGTAFGAATAALLDEGAVPATGLTPPPWDSGVGTHAFGLASHLVFGLVIEAVRRQVDATLAPKD